MDIDKIESCPHCGDAFGYYTRIYVSGWTRDVTLYERGKYSSERVKQNTEMHDSLSYTEKDKNYYCVKCNKKICKKISKP